MRLMRLPEVKQETGYRSHKSIYDLVRDGLLTKGVRISAQSVAWPAHEVHAINVARIAGKTPDEIRALVKRLHEKRQEMAAALEVV